MNRKFPYQYLFPLVISLMMLIVVLKHSIWRDMSGRGGALRRFGLFMDVALVIYGAGRVAGIPD